MKCPHCNGTGELEPDKSTVGTLIWASRRAQGMTQEELSGKVGLSRAQIANIESGRSDMPMKTLFKFAAALECSPKDLVP